MQARFDTFVHQYNHDRPHQALDMATPASRYQEWTALSRLTLTQVAQATDLLESMREGLVGRIDSLRRIRFKPHRGERPRLEQHLLLRLLAEAFLAEGLRPTTASGGLFASVAVVVHPNQPMTIKHSLLAKAIAEANREWDTHKVTLAAPPPPPPLAKFGLLADLIKAR